MHLPLGAAKKLDPQAFKAQFDQFQVHAGITEFVRVQFPKQSGAPLVHFERYEVRRNLKLQECTFADHLELLTNGAEIDMSDTRFLGAFQLCINGPGDIICRGSVFEGPLRVECMTQPSLLDASRSKFCSTLDFNSVEDMRALAFTGCAFQRAPTFGRSPRIPQKTFFNDAQFHLSAEDEPSYRVIRNFFNAHRARDTEGQFYAREKRCHRFGMGYRPHRWIPRAISFLYDWTSQYGYSYGWALFWFCVVQVTFGLTYAWLSGRLAHLRGSYDSHVASFTFAQVVKPFELFSARASTGGPYAILPDPVSGTWLLLTAAHSVFSIVLIALFLLALRWRFRRE